MSSLVLLDPPVPAASKGSAALDVKHALKPADDLNAFIATLLPARSVSAIV
jgi:hypothetical protein